MKPAAHEDAEAETRTAAKWLIAAFAGVGALLLSGVGLTSLGHLEGERLLLAGLAFAGGIAGVVVAIYLIADVLTPFPVTLGDLANYEQRRNEKANDGRNDELVAYIEADPTFLQGIVDRKKVDPTKTLGAASKQYQDALDERFRAANASWEAAKANQDPAKIKDTEIAATAAMARAETMHWTVRRLEKISSAQQSVLVFRRRRMAIALTGLLVAVSIGAFAFASNPPDPALADLRGATLEDIDLSGASLREANLEGMSIRKVNFDGTNLEGAKIDETVWKNTICPDGTNSKNAGDTCAGHLSPDFSPGALP